MGGKQLIMRNNKSAALDGDIVPAVLQLQDLGSLVVLTSKGFYLSNQTSMKDNIQLKTFTITSPLIGCTL